MTYFLCLPFPTVCLSVGGSIRSGRGREVHDGAREGQLAQQEVSHLCHTGEERDSQHYCMCVQQYGHTHCATIHSTHNVQGPTVHV